MPAGAAKAVGAVPYEGDKGATVATIEGLPENVFRLDEFTGAVSKSTGRRVIWKKDLSCIIVKDVTEEEQAGALVTVKREVLKQYCKHFPDAKATIKM